MLECAQGCSSDEAKTSSAKEINLVTSSASSHGTQDLVDCQVLQDLGVTLEQGDHLVPQGQGDQPDLQVRIG